MEGKVSRYGDFSLSLCVQNLTLWGKKSQLMRTKSHLMRKRTFDLVITRSPHRTAQVNHGHRIEEAAIVLRDRKKVWCA